MNENAEIATQLASAAKWGGATAAVIGGLSITEWLGVFGLAMAIIGTVAQIWINLHYKRKEDRRGMRPSKRGGQNEPDLLCHVLQMVAVRAKRATQGGGQRWRLMHV